MSSDSVYVSPQHTVKDASGLRSVVRVVVVAVVVNVVVCVLAAWANHQLAPFMDEAFKITEEAPTLARTYRRWWWSLLGIFNLVLLTLVAQQVGRILPAKDKNGFDRLLGFVFPVLLLIYWQWIVTNGYINPRWFPPPTKIAEALYELIANFDNKFEQTSMLGLPFAEDEISLRKSFAEARWSGIWQNHFLKSHVWVTLQRVFLGFLIGTIPGIILGVLMGLNRTLRLMLDSTLSAIYVLPKIAIFPIMMLLFGNITGNPFGEGPIIAVVAISSFFLVTFNTITGVRDINPVLLMAGKNYGANPIQMFRHVIFPAALPVIFAGMRIALGTSLIVVVAVEFIRAKSGVGRTTFYHWEILATEKMYAGLLVVMLLGVLLTYGLQWFERRLMPWVDT